MYKINSLEINNDFLHANVSIELPDKSELVCNVPVKFPKSKEEVIAAIEDRERNELVKANALPVLTAIKSEMDRDFVGKASTDFPKVP